MRRVCFYHAGCPDGFGAAWSLWRAWGDSARFVPRGHDDTIDAEDYEGDQVVFVDIAPPNEDLIGLSRHCAQVVVLDHHVSSKNRYESDPAAARAVDEGGHQVVFDLSHSGAVLAWQYFGDGEPPELLRYVEDQDLWSWKLHRSEEVNAAIGSYPRRFEVWDELAARSVDDMVREGEPILRFSQMEVERALTGAHPLTIESSRIEAVNSAHHRSRIGHELAKRSSFRVAWGCVYRIVSGRVDVSLYSIGDVDVSRVAQQQGGGGHQNAAGFSVPLSVWLRDFV